MVIKDTGRFNISSAFLHIIAMLFMLCDHIWATLLPGQRWLTLVGRAAFPIFAFMIVEGYFHTHDLKKYMGRMLAFAVLSEIPFDFMYGSAAFYPYHQNVLWTFLIALAGIWLMERQKAKGKLWLTVLTDIAVVLFGMALGQLLQTDYYGAGVLTVFVFYFFRGRKWWCFPGQLAVLYYLNAELIGGLCYIITIFGREYEVVRQGFAVFALIPIWLYNGRQGYHEKWFKYLCYSFYPLHIAVLVILQKLGV